MRGAIYTGAEQTGLTYLLRRLIPQCVEFSGEKKRMMAFYHDNMIALHDMNFIM
jgi:hypothetical protein